LSVTLAWDPPDDPSVVGYVVSYGTSPGSHPHEMDVGDAVTVDITGLNETDTYYFVVQSYDASGQRSDPSDEVIYASFSITCRVTNAVSPNGNPVAVTLTPPIIIGGTPHPDTATCVPPSGSLFPVGSTPVTCSASDATRTVSCQSVVTVTYDGSQTFSLSASPEVVGAGAQLTVQWTAPPNCPSLDWIGLYAVDSDNTSYIWWAYTDGAQSGTFDLSAPFDPGTYEFRYLQNDGYVDVTRSNTIVVNMPSTTLTASPASVRPRQPLTVSWTASPGSASLDWVGLFPVGSPNDGYVWWTYTGGATRASVTIPAPRDHGSYEFRYLLNDGYTSVARSNSVTVSQ
jgi:hypothetical protein